MNDILHNEHLFSSDALENDTELIPLITAEDEELMNAEVTPPKLPLLPLRNTVLFPGVVIPITVGRDRSIRRAETRATYKAPVIRPPQRSPGSVGRLSAWLLTGAWPAVIGNRRSPRSRQSL